MDNIKNAMPYFLELLIEWICREKFVTFAIIMISIIMIWAWQE